MKTLSKEKDFVCATPEVAEDILKCLEEQLEYVVSSCPNCLADWNEDNCKKEYDNVRSMINNFYVERTMSMFLEVENAMLQLFRDCQSSLILAVNPDEEGKYRITKEHLLSIGWKPEQIERMEGFFK